ncbi:hypothetical protein [Engelhardtia mirabilis]|uniref:Uncharacterized protein n=1 Tax=Engelhardtia mirabilis TaxID=2528011 RepID=A0A518BMN5_9BACT|nr:hypothetical protein Pla133_32970 [Planctomycetes bacterium Pla133]QDV02529.1 hypothetical protein Pla86_32960 [Planctomycetes bacterium Pla86]
MTQDKHWLGGTSFLPLFSEAIEGTEKLLADRLDRRGEIDRSEDILTTILIETLQSRLDTVNGSLRDLSASRPNQPAVSKFDFSICDMRDPKGDALGADFAFIFRVRWDHEFVSERGILVQAKRLGPLSVRTVRRLNREVERRFGVSAEELEGMAHFLPGPFRPPRLRRSRFPWLFWPGLGFAFGEDTPLGDFPIDQKQLDELLQIASSYYLFYDHPLPHMTLPCIQALTVKGLVAGGKTSEICRPSAVRHSTSLTDLLVNQFVGCRIGEWNRQFEQLASIADQHRVGGLEGPRGDFNVHVWNVRFVVMLEISLLPEAYQGE